MDEHVVVDGNIGRRLPCGATAAPATGRRLH